MIGTSRRVAFIGMTVTALSMATGCVQSTSPAAHTELDPQSKKSEPAPSAAGSDQGKRSEGTDWPRFLGPNGDSTSPENGIIAPWPKEGLRLVWHREIGSGYAAPTVSQGRLFVFDRQGDRNCLTCLDSKTGKFHWKFEYPTTYVDKYAYNGGPRCSPIVDGDRVYLYGPEGMLHCVRVTDGKQVWKVDTVKEFNVVQNFFGVGSTPLVEGDLLITQVGGSPPKSDPDDFLALKGNGTGIVAFDKYTGKVVYKITDELASYSSPVAATIDKRRWCFVFVRGGLVGFDPANGKVRFHFPWRADMLESVNAANPVIIGDKVFIGETYELGGALLQIKGDDYKVLWTDEKKTEKKKSMACHWMTPIYLDGHLYGCSGRHGDAARLQCIDLASGKINWTEPRLTRTSLLYVDGHFVVLTAEGELLLLRANPKKFDLVSTMKPTDPATGDDLLKYPCWAAPILSHGLMYIRSDGQLVCLELIPQKKSN